MRILLHLMALVALLVAPLAAPAAVMPMAGAAKSAAAECTEMSMDLGGHEKPAGHHGQDKACCIAIPPAIDPPLAALDPAVAIDHLAFVAAIEPFRLGAGPKAEDPPPRRT